MKKFILLLVITALYMSCQEEKKVYKTYTIAVTYIDNTVDTLEVTSDNEPFLRVDKGVSSLNVKYWKPIACYVKKFKIIKTDERKLY